MFGFTSPLASSLVVLSLVASLVAAQATFGTNGTAYDFIIVGGGTAGLALATRLTQRLSYTVLVIEAGPDGRNAPGIYIPGLKGSTVGGVYDYNFTTIPQAHVNSRRMPQARGKVLGGSSALNLMTWDRAADIEYDKWQELGNPGWNWNTMLPAMLKAEDFLRDPNTHGTAGVATGGPIDTVINTYIPAQQTRWIPTLNSLGLQTNLESLGGNPIGVMYQPSNIRPSDWTRSYSASGYVPIAGANMYVLVGKRVQKINLQADGNALKATGVVLEDGTVYTARKEVILSAGTFQSPGLLELSGIGRSSVLSAAGITQLLDLPGVGENLQDHMRIQNNYELKPGFQSPDRLRFDPTFAAQERAKYDANIRPNIYQYTGSGYAFMTWKQVLGQDGANKMYTLANQATASTPGGFERKKNLILLDYILKSDKVPNVEFIFSDGYTGYKGYPPAETPGNGKQFFTLIASILHLFSTGSVHITSNNVATPPAINPQYLTHDYDLQALIEAAKYMRKIANTAPLKDVWVAENEPGLNDVPLNAGDDVWASYVLNATNTVFHPVGTCAMLPRADGGVVDNNLKVYGTKNLRVVDASIFPIELSAHIQTAVYGVAEMAADRIVAAWS